MAYPGWSRSFRIGEGEGSFWHLVSCDSAKGPFFGSGCHVLLHCRQPGIEKEVKWVWRRPGSFLSSHMGGDLFSSKKPWNTRYSMRPWSCEHDRLWLSLAVRLRIHVIAGKTIYTRKAGGVQEGDHSERERDPYGSGSLGASGVNSQQILIYILAFLLWSCLRWHKWWSQARKATHWYSIPVHIGRKLAEK